MAENDRVWVGEPYGHRRQFSWTTFDVGPLLPEGWQIHLTALADTAADEKVITPTSVTSRESSTATRLPVFVVGGAKIRSEVPWLFEMYGGIFLDLAQRCTEERVTCAREDSYAINVNVQKDDGSRYECHVDSNPLQGMLYVTSHAPGSGGELVVANRTDARSVDDVEADASVIPPTAGHLVFFDARLHAHYVRPLVGRGTRTAVAFNYYTSSFPESARPGDLSRHLGVNKA